MKTYHNTTTQAERRGKKSRTLFDPELCIFPKDPDQDIDTYDRCTDDACCKEKDVSGRRNR